jgi:ubiquinone biosynthesis protein COQ4
MRKILNMVKFASTYLRLVRDTGRLELVFALADALDNPGGELPPGLQMMLERPEVAAFLASEPRPLRFELPVLRRMPEGSLGRAFAAFLDARKLDPDGLYHSDAAVARTDLDRFKLHMERSHDLWHTVLGFDTDIAGELGLQVFTIAQLDSPLGYIIVSGGLLNGFLFAPRDGRRRMEAITRGWRLGLATRPLFGADWEGMMTWPLERVREHFGVRAEDVRAAALAA